LIYDWTEPANADYGYPGGGQDAQPNVQLPDNDGIVLAP